MMSKNDNLEVRYSVLFNQYKELKEEYNKLKQAYSQSLEQYHSEYKLRIDQSQQINQLNSQIHDLESQLQLLQSQVHHLESQLQHSPQISLFNHSHQPQHNWQFSELQQTSPLQNVDQSNTLSPQTLRDYARSLCARSSSKINSINFISPKQSLKVLETDSPLFIDDFTSNKLPQILPDRSIEAESEDLNLIEAFLIVGLSTENLKGSGCILYESGGDSLSPSAREILLEFCFPGGINLNSIRISEFLSPSLEEPKPFIFTLQSSNQTVNKTLPNSLPNADKQVLYFSCLKTDQFIEDGETVYITEQVYCLVSYIPIFDVHFSLLSSIIDSRENFEVVEYCKKYEWIKSKRIELERIGLSYNIPEDLSTIDLEYVCFPLLSCITVKDVFKILCGILQEKSVIFISQNLGLVSCCVLGILALLRPFKWPYICIPIIPDTLKELVEAPVPLIGGTRGNVCKKQSNHIIFIDLDEPNIYYRIHISKELLQDLEEAEDLELDSRLRGFSKVLEEEREGEEKLRLKGNEREREICLKIAEAIKGFWWKIIRTIPEDFIDDFKSLSRYLKTKLSIQNHKFIEKVLQTQIFINLIEEIF